MSNIQRQSQPDLDIFRLAEMMAKTGYFKDATDAGKAVVKILAGQELGFGAFTSMANIAIVQGKPTISANLIAACIKRSQRYDFRVVKMDDTICTLKFFEMGEEVGVSSFSMEDARKAKLSDKDIWKSYPRNMLFSRAISNGAKWYCADVFMTGVYTPEELGGEDDPTAHDYTAGMDKTPEQLRGEEPRQLPAAEYRKITASELKRFCASASERGWTDEEQHKLISAKGYTSRKDITTEHFEMFLVWLADASMHGRVQAALYKERMDSAEDARVIGEEDGEDSIAEMAEAA